MTNQELISRGELIRDETVTGANTAQRVGEAFVAIGENLEEVADDSVKVKSFGHDYYKEFDTGNVPTSTTNIESFGFGGKTGDVLQVIVGAQGYVSGQKFLVLYGKETASSAWVALTGASYYSSVSRRKTLEGDYAELGFLLGTSITSAEVKASLLDEEPALSDILSKVEGYYICTSSPQEKKTITSNFFRLRNGGSIIIYFTFSNTMVAPVTLNINGTGEKMLYLNGKPVGIDNTWQKGSVCLCWYDGFEQHYNIKVLFDVYGDSLMDSFSVIKDICLNLLKWDNITASLQLTSGKYIAYQNTTTSLGQMVSSSSYYYSSPISLSKGDVIKVRSYGNQYCIIQESDENGNVLTRLVSETSRESGYKNYTYIATKDMYVVVNVQNSATYPYAILKAAGMPTLLNLLEKSNYLFNGSTNRTGDTLFTSSQASPGDTLFYRIRTASSNWCIRLYYLEEGTRKFVNYVFKNPCVPNQDYYGKFTIPSDIDFIEATTGWSSVNATIAKNGTMGAESIMLIMMQDELAEVQSSLENHSNLPSYYNEYLDGKEAEIRNLQLDIQGEEDSFIFITDTHWIDNYKQSLAIIEYLLKRGLTNKVVFGGDLMGLHSDVNKETLDETLEYIKTQIDFHRKFASTVLSCGGKFFNVRGNHDINGYPATKATQQGDNTIEMWRAPENATKNILFDQIEESGRISNREGSNYVYDNDTKKIRYIFVGDAKENNNPQYSFPYASVDWFVERLADTPASYDIVVICHYGALKSTLTNFLPDMDDIIKAFNERGEVNVVRTINNETFTKSKNFEGATSKVIAYISGHTHKNLQSFSAGVTHICIACDARYSENPYMNEKPYYRAQGDITEQLFDFIQIDKAANMIYCKRIGAGYDRYFHTQPISVANGDSITLQSSMLSGELTWGCYDNDNAVTKTDSAQLTATRVSVLDGVVTGNAVGEAVVYAMDETGNREFFEVIVG